MPKTRKVKPRTHREWFRVVSRGNRKSCSHCRQKLDDKEWIWSWGEYRNAKFRSIRDVCKKCWPELKTELNKHVAGCGCKVEIECRGAEQPAWLNLGVEEACVLPS